MGVRTRARVEDLALKGFTAVLGLGRYNRSMAATRMIWAALALLRIAWCLFPQSSYIHPDEFFQSPEVMAGDILDLQAYRPWEFLASFPCRTVFFPLITSGATFWIMSSLTHLGLLRTPITSYSLLVLPRLCFTIFSFLLDYSVYRLAPFWTADRWRAMVLLAGSYVTLVFYTRTFNNVIEGILFAILLMLVSSNAANNSKSRTPLTNKANHSSLIGAILVAGCFNRPTFFAFAFAPVLYWAGKQTGFIFDLKTITINILKLVPSVTSTALIFIATDTVYFNHKAPEDHQSFGINHAEGFIALASKNIVVTPLNFLRYNINPQNLAQHGLHPRITHFAVNGAMLFGILHISATLSIGKVLTKAGSDHQATRPILLLFYFVPLALLSLFPHQEPRHIIPLIVPLVLWSTQQKQAIPWKSAIIPFNLLGALVFGCLHQGGLIPCMSHLEQVIHTKGALEPTHYTLLFTHTYMPPRYLLNLKKQDTSVQVFDLAGRDESQLCKTLAEFVRNVSHGNSPNREARRHSFYVITPGTVKPALNKCGIAFKNETFLFPHLTMEDPPQISTLFSDKWRSQLELYILQLETHA
ncbi:GPI mannosyltransferase 4 isoform X2 [Ambystoma mexicanum]|uniref:GPI mannosyltransferase 4 isoform X2 n=1 Tax=Ambystoma mexicanum TaxID=8296 RepID=UPI0037E7C919